MRHPDIISLMIDPIHMSTIDDLPHAIFGAASVNELELRQKSKAESQDPLDPDPSQPSHDDPVAFRFGAWANPLGRLKWYIAKISLDVLRWVDGKIHRTEVGFIKFAVDELYNNDGKPLPMVAIYLTENATDSTDQAQQPVMIWTRAGIRCLVPFIVEAGINAPVTSKVTRFYTDHGRYVVNWQDDTGWPSGVVYDTHDSIDESTWTHVGTVRIDPK